MHFSAWTGVHIKLPSKHQIIILCPTHPLRSFDVICGHPLSLLKRISDLRKIVDFRNYSSFFMKAIIYHNSWISTGFFQQNSVENSWRILPSKHKWKEFWRWEQNSLRISDRNSVWKAADICIFQLSCRNFEDESRIL